MENSGFEYGTRSWKIQKPTLVKKILNFLKIRKYPKIESFGLYKFHDLSDNKTYNIIIQKTTDTGFIIGTVKE